MKVRLEEIGKALMALREEKGMTRKQLAIKAGVSLTRVKWYELNHEVPAFDTVVRVLSALGYDVRILERRKK